MVDVLAPRCWTMNVPLNRKRSRLAPDDDADDDDVQRQREPSPALSAFSDTLKRSKTHSELDELAIVSPEEAWTLDIDLLLASNTLAQPPNSSLEAHNNWGRYNKGESIIILCVQGNVQVHYELLCAAIPSLYTLSPTLQTLILCHDPMSHTLSPTAPFSLPLVQAVAPPHNHFVRLGLLHPLGGGKFPLDALVVLDKKGRRRLVLPFGWGAGKWAGTPAGKGVEAQLMQLLGSCVGVLESEGDV